ncbi:MAG: hypothetical protein ABJE95_35010 [Byssovorax sp.]
MVIGLGCLLLAGCGPANASDDADLLNAPLLAQDEAFSLGDPAPESGHVDDSIKGCPACHGVYNPATGEITYDIPEGVAVSTTMTLVLGYADGTRRSFTFEGQPSATALRVAEAFEGSLLSADLLFLSDAGWMSVSLAINSDAPMPHDL